MVLLAVNKDVCLILYEGNVVVLTKVELGPAAGSSPLLVGQPHGRAMCKRRVERWTVSSGEVHDYDLELEQELPPSVPQAVGVASAGVEQRRDTNDGDSDGRDYLYVVRRRKRLQR